MKNKKLIIGLILILILIIGAITTYILIQNSKDSYKFKKEYESYNNKSWEYEGKKGKYLNIEINKDNPIIYLNDENIVKELKEGDKIIYFGFPDCNWCRAALPVLLKSAEENGVEKIYYYDFGEVRETFEKNKNNEKAKIYQQIIEVLDSNITSTFESGAKKGEKRLSAPTVVLMKDGKVSSFHYRTVESHQNYNKNLTTEEYNELYKIYEDMMIDLIMCTSDC
ncbi:MAG: thioredoxin family protein [Bacilli bacterium]